MKVRKAIKRIAAIGAGATMLGATLMGAMAADLSDYPNMFIKDGHFNGLLVVGQNADTIDTIGMTNIALGLQKAAVTKTTVCGEGATSTTTVSDGVRIDKSGTHMNYGNSIYDVTSTLDDSDLPNILADGEYSESEGNTDNNEDYTQVLNFVDGTGTMSYVQDDDGAEDAGSYLKFVDTSGKYAYQYRLEFDSPVEYDTEDASDDLKSTSIDIQGQPYTITDAHFTSGHVLDKLTLMAGQSMMWIGQGETVTKTIDGVDHTIKMIDVNNEATACGFEVDGSTVWIDKDSTETVNDVTLGVTDALAVYTEHYDGDMCKIFIGAEELVLEDGQKVKKAGTDVDGSEVSLSAASASTAGYWTGLTITWTPDDDTYLAAGDELVDPVFGNFKFVYGGVSKTTEDIDFTASSSDAEFVFTNDDNKEVTIPITYNDSSTKSTQLLFGEDADRKQLYYYGNNVCQDDDDVRDCEGSLWLVMDGHTAHVLKIDDIDTTNDQINFEDVTYDTSDTDNDYTNGSYSDIYVSGVGTLSVNVDEANYRVTIKDDSLGDPTSGGTQIETKYGAMVTTFDATGGNVTIGLKENDDSAIPSASLVTANVTFAYDSGSDERVEIKTPSMTAGNFYGGTGGYDMSDTNNDDKRWATKYGSVIEYDSDNEDQLTIVHPDDWVEGDVFVAPTSASVSSTEQTPDGCSVSETPNPIPSTVNKFDSEVTDYKSNNVIAIGGPCANTVSAALLGNPEVCYEGFEEGKSLLQLFQFGDNVALLVAGGNGKDTRAASKILQDYENYDLSGTKMEATTVSMTVKPWTETVVTTPADDTEADDTGAAE